MLKLRFTHCSCLIDMVFRVVGIQCDRLSFRAAVHLLTVPLSTLTPHNITEVDIESGILFYLKSDNMIQVPVIKDEIRGILMRRNEIASYIQTRNRLPPMKRDLHGCARCFSLDACTVYHKVC